MTEPTQTDLAAILAAGAQRRSGRGWLAVAGLALAGLLSGWWLLSGDADAIAYDTTPVTRGNLVVQVTATGSVQPTTQVDVSSELSGTLAVVEVDYNDRVEVGQVLARLDDTKFRANAANAEAQLAAAQGRLLQAEATLREAEAAWESQSELDRRGISSRNSSVTAQAARDRAAAAVDIARADLTLAEANLSIARADVDKAALRSPIRGIVLNRTAEAGQIVASSLNAPVLFTLAEDLSRMELRVDVDEADIGRVTAGQTAEFTVDAYPGRSFPARITQVRYAPETLDAVVTYKAILGFENPDGLLRPGMTATATITVAEAADALLVPNAALRYAPPAAAEESEGGSGLIGLIMPRRPAATRGEASGRAVWVLRGGTPVEVPVIPGDSDGTRTAVSGEGLAEGDAVITAQRARP